MPTIDEKLEALFAKVRALPEPRQQLIVETLTELTDPTPYRLSGDELAVLEPELEGARRGEFASQAEVDAILNKPWTKS